MQHKMSVRAFVQKINRSSLARTDRRSFIVISPSGIRDELRDARRNASIRIRVMAGVEADDVDGLQRQLWVTRMVFQRCEIGCALE